MLYGTTNERYDCYYKKKLYFNSGFIGYKTKRIKAYFDNQTFFLTNIKSLVENLIL